MKWHKISDAEAAQRLDVTVAEWLGLSRSQSSGLIKSGQVMLDNARAKSSWLPIVGQKLTYNPMGSIDSKAEVVLPIVYEDDALLIIDKPAGLVVHPTGPGDHQSSVVDFAKRHTTDSENLRPGIVHRIDKDTSGLVIIAKTAKSKAQLQRLFRSRQVQKQYIALVKGHLAKKEAEINLPIAKGTGVKRSVQPGGRSALTRYEVVKFYQKFSLLNVWIESGRTHQIRVHLAAIGYPVVGDGTYGTTDSNLKRQFLHAHKLSFTSPTGVQVSAQSPLPNDLKDYLQSLK